MCSSDLYNDNSTNIRKIDPNSLSNQVIYSSPTYIEKIVLSLNGSKIAFISGNNDNANLESIYTINLDGSDLIETTSHNGRMDELSWAANGSAILYYLRNYDTRKNELWTVNTNGSNKSKLDINFDYYDYPRWSTKNLKDDKTKDKDKHSPRIRW